MRREGTTVYYTAEELEAMRRRGEGRTNWAAVRAMTDEEVEASIDDDEEGHPDWGTLSSELPGPMVTFTLAYDPSIIEWFQAQGPDFETKINDVLRAYIEAHLEKKTA